MRLTQDFLIISGVFVLIAIGNLADPYILIGVGVAYLGFMGSYYAGYWAGRRHHY